MPAEPPSKSSEPEIRLIVGLGNPGRKYDRTRHNVGFDIVDRLVNDNGLRLRFDKKWNAETARNDAGIIFAKPQTFMNLSGEAVSKLVKFFKLTSRNVLVVYDDVDLPIGRMRFREEGSAGGHNGIKSIIQHLGTNQVPRLKVGVGGAGGREEMIEHVLGRFAPDEREEIEKSLANAVEAVKCALARGLTESMNRFNQNPAKKKTKPSPPPATEESS